MTKYRVPPFTDEEVEYGIFYVHQERTPKSRDVDEHMTSRITQNPWQWLDDPNRYDFMGIDTLGHAKPSGYTKSKGRQAAQKLKRVQFGF